MLCCLIFGKEQQSMATKNYFTEQCNILKKHHYYTKNNVQKF